MSSEKVDLKISDQDQKEKELHDSSPLSFKNSPLNESPDITNQSPINFPKTDDRDPFHSFHTDQSFAKEDTIYWANRITSVTSDPPPQTTDSVFQAVSNGQWINNKSNESPSSRTKNPQDPEYVVFKQNSLSRFPSISLAERMADSHGVPVSHESVANFRKEVHTDGELVSELQLVFSTLQKCLKFRHKYMTMSFQQRGDNPKDQPNWKIYPPFAQAHETKEFDIKDCEIPGPHHFVYSMAPDGVFYVYPTETDKENNKHTYTMPNLKEYYKDLDYILDVISDGPTKSFAFRRLRYLESKFNMYVLLNDYQEMADSKVPHRDFYNVRKIDTHVHHSSCMNQKHLLSFIKNKLKHTPNDVVIFRDRRTLTLAEVFDSLKLTAHDLSIDTLDMHAHKDSFHRFDKFNLKYNPVGESRLREIFLKTDNLIDGRYLAEITQQVINDLEVSKYQMAEYRISIYGKSKNEWNKLAKWIINNKLFSSNVRWLIQVPRLYSVYKGQKIVNSFEDVIKNIFEPLFEVTKNPQDYPEFHIFLQRVVGFDSVDDESKTEKRTFKKYPCPKAWNISSNPPYTYYLYYMYANITSLNFFRKERGFNTFAFRPHAGEAGDPDHLASAFLTSESISHGILLRKVPVLQYLFYLDQIGICMSPLSNNALFLAYERNPFLTFFHRGMNISLSTDDPLQFHFTREPLIEEYSVAAQIFKLSSTDLCELARNSVLMSGWELSVKKKWLGDDCYVQGPAGNDIQKTNVPNIRLSYRYQTLMEERFMVLGSASNTDSVFDLTQQLQNILGSVSDNQSEMSASIIKSNSYKDLCALNPIVMGHPPEPLIIGSNQRKQSLHSPTLSPRQIGIRDDDVNFKFLLSDSPAMPYNLANPYLINPNDKDTQVEKGP